MTAELEHIDIPDVIGPVVGWRIWTIQRDRLKRKWELRSPQRSTLWEPREWTVATCPIWTGYRIRQERAHAHRSSGAFVRYWDAEPNSVPDHDAPGKDCRCGLYIVSSNRKGIIRGHAAAASWGKTGLGMVYGSVEIAGRYLEYTDGWRVERARVRSLCLRTLRPSSEHIIRELAAAYDVPVMDGPIADYADVFLSERGR